MWGSGGFESGLVELDRTIEVLEEDRKIVFKFGCGEIELGDEEF